MASVDEAIPEPKNQAMTSGVLANQNDHFCPVKMRTTWKQLEKF